jgi:serine/threonine protein kinase
VVVVVVNALVMILTVSPLAIDDAADNIGFEDPDGLGSDTTNGVLKVFDFDVARILPEKDVSNSTVPLFQMTKRVGSPRYMSPECARGDPYNEKADVYTVGLLCYELLTLIKPYHDISPEQHDDAIFHNGARPALPHMMDHDKAVQAAAVLAKKMDHVNPTPGRVSAAKVLSQSQKAALVPAKQPHVQFWSASLRTLVQRMWNQNIDQRPSMEQARRALEEECHEISRKLQHLEAELERHWQEQVQQQHVDLEEEDVAVPEPAVVKGDDADKPTRGFSLRLWKSSANNGSSSKLLNRSRHGSNRSRTSSMGGTSRTAGVTSTTGLSSSNFASFNNLAALNTLQEQQQ